VTAPRRLSRRLGRADSGFGKRFDDHVRYAFGHLVGEKEDPAWDCDDTYVGTRLEGRPFVSGQRAITLFGVHDPGWYACFAEPPLGVVVAM
jgi:hypothetical protein